MAWNDPGEGLRRPDVSWSFPSRSCRPAIRGGDVPRHYIGPAFETGEGFEPPGLRDYALITFGTLSNNDTRRFEAAMRGAFLAGYSAVAVCGGKVDLRYLGGVARSLEEAHPGQTAMVVDRVPELEPWILGADVVIHHAGTATTWESIRFRKPALFIPINADQKVHASLLEQQALGVRLASGREVEPEAIAHGLESVRKIAYSGERFHRRMAQAGGAAAGVDIIVRTLETQA